MKLLEHIKAVDTGNRRPVLDPMIMANLKMEATPHNFAREYSIRVTIGSNQWIDEELIKSSKGEVVQYAIEQMKYNIVEEVYGELRRDLLELHRDLRSELNYHYQDSASLKKLEEILEKITL